MKLSTPLAWRLSFGTSVAGAKGADVWCIQMDQFVSLNHRAHVLVENPSKSFPDLCYIKLFLMIPWFPSIYHRIHGTRIFLTFTIKLNHSCR